MATLNSPGVSVQVIDESFYSSAAPGTVPLIIVTSQENKQNGSNTGIAPGTLASNAGAIYLLTSQKDLVDNFGVPVFQTDANNNPVHAGELNEYGLQAAYSYLGISNQVFIARANVNLSELNPTPYSPAGKPINGQYWIDTASSKYGIQIWDSAPAIAGGQKFTNVEPLVITDHTLVNNFSAQDYKPTLSVGLEGTYAISAVSTLLSLWYKKPVTTSESKWVEVGSTDWFKSIPVFTSSKNANSVTFTSSGATPDTFSIGGTEVLLSSGATNLTELVNGINAQNAPYTAFKTSTGRLQLFSDGTANSYVITGAASTLAALGLSAGTYLTPSFQVSTHTDVPVYKRGTGSVSGRPTGSVWVKTTTPNAGAEWSVKQYNSATNTWVSKSAPLYSTNAEALYGLDSTGGGYNIAGGSVYVKYNVSQSTPALGDFKLYRRTDVGSTLVSTVPVTAAAFPTGQYTFAFKFTAIGTTDISSHNVTINITPSDNTNAVVIDLIEAGFKTFNDPAINIFRSPTGNDILCIKHVSGGDIYFEDGANTPISKLFNPASTLNFYHSDDAIATHYTVSLWSPLTDDKLGGFAINSPDAPTTSASDGQVWYSSIVDEVDILINDGTTWKGYKNVNLGSGTGATDPNGPIVSATKPLVQSDKTPLAEGDLWIDTSDLENYPQIHRYSDYDKAWTLIDNTDQTTDNGIVFHDARWATAGDLTDPSTITALLSSDYVDADAPDPVLYPKGMLLWNLRRSGFNVKKYVANYFSPYNHNLRYQDELMTAYSLGRWVSQAPNQENGAGTFGRHSQRSIVLNAINELLLSNQALRDVDRTVFNLLAVPGYPEAIPSAVSLNYDRGISAFVIGDSPARLTPDATSLNNWGTNLNNALTDGDNGLVTTDPYLGVFYPWGYTTDLTGNNIVVPPSHIMLRTIALSDNVSYPWFAPAGVRRGGITNASSVGYVDMNGEFQSIALNNGQRDVLSAIHVNPLTYISGTGLVNYGQKTRQLTASSLDRINVARLAIHCRQQLTQLAKPFIFEPNDNTTRNAVRTVVTNLFLGLITQRAISDFVVVCDKSNNTSARIDRNELYIDIAIVPLKSVEMIYIPLRLKNTGALTGAGA